MTTDTYTRTLEQPRPEYPHTPIYYGVCYQCWRVVWARPCAESSAGTVSHGLCQADADAIIAGILARQEG